MNSRQNVFNRHSRRGAVAPMLAVSGAVLLGFAALSIDVGMLYNVRMEAQRAADAAAMAGVAELIDESRLATSPDLWDGELKARQQSLAYAWLNQVDGETPIVFPNLANEASGDIVVGYLADQTDRTTPLSLVSPSEANAVCVRIRRDEEHWGQVGLTFARIFGMSQADVVAEATAMVNDEILGFEASPEHGNPKVMPFALAVDAWKGLLAGTWTTGDSYGLDEDGNVVSGSDGILELNLYPGAGPVPLPPGNFGTVDVGADNNSASDIRRQILYGPSEEDLSYLGGSLQLGPDGTLLLNGDTGISAGMKDALETIKGEPRTILLFTEVSGPGNNAMYTIVGFAGVRIMDVKLTGSVSKKSVTIQPAIVVDPTAISNPGGTNPGRSDFIYQPPTLVR